MTHTEQAMQDVKHILVATDFSRTSERAVQVAARLARHHRARVTLLHAFDAMPLSPLVSYPTALWTGTDFATVARQESDKLLVETRQAHLEDVPDVELVAVAHNSASVAITDHAREVGAELIILGTHGRTGLANLLLGSVAAQVLRHASCSVLAVRPTIVAAEFPKRILVTTDFSPAATAALEAAAHLARRFDGASLTLVHVYETMSKPFTDHPAYRAYADVDSELRAALSKLGNEHLTADVSTELLVGESAANAIVEYAKNNQFDLITVATHGRTGLSRLLLGSVAEKVTRLAACPVWCARSTTKDKT